MPKPGPKKPDPAKIEQARKDETAKTLAYLKKLLAKQGK